MDTAVDEGFAWVEGAGGPVLRSRALGSVANHVFTSRTWLTRQPDADDGRRLAVELGDASMETIGVKQVHGRSVLVIRPGDEIPTDRPAADAIVSVDPARGVFVRVADCVPILVADRSHRVVAAIHAGWRGTCAAVTVSTIAQIEELGVPPADLVVAIGPSIGPCCYQVDDRVRTAFLGITPDAAGWFAEDGPGHWRLDLWQANVEQLQDAGVPAAAIHVAGVCTADHLDTCFSFRKEGAAAGRMMAAIRLSTRP